MSGVAGDDKSTLLGLVTCTSHICTPVAGIKRQQQLETAECWQPFDRLATRLWALTAACGSNGSWVINPTEVICKRLMSRCEP